MNIFQIMSLLGVPSFFSIIAYFIKKFKQYQTEMDAIKAGMQAMLRAQMVADYNLWHNKGYAPLYAKDNFENVWKKYDALGENGVMSSIHDEFMALPFTPDVEEETNE